MPAENQKAWCDKPFALPDTRYPVPLGMDKHLGVNHARAYRVEIEWKLDDGSKEPVNALKQIHPDEGDSEESITVDQVCQIVLAMGNMHANEGEAEEPREYRVRQFYKDDTKKDRKAFWKFTVHPPGSAPPRRQDDPYARHEADEGVTRLDHAMMSMERQQRFNNEANAMQMRQMEATLNTVLRAQAQMQTEGRLQAAENRIALKEAREQTNKAQDRLFKMALALTANNEHQEQLQQKSMEMFGMGWQWYMFAMQSQLTGQERRHRDEVERLREQKKEDNKWSWVSQFAPAFLSFGGMIMSKMGSPLGDFLTSAGAEAAQAQAQAQAAAGMPGFDGAVPPGFEAQGGPPPGFEAGPAQGASPSGFEPPSTSTAPPGAPPPGYSPAGAYVPGGPPPGYNPAAPGSPGAPPPGYSPSPPPGPPGAPGGPPGAPTSAPPPAAPTIDLSTLSLHERANRFGELLDAEGWQKLRAGWPPEIMEAFTAFVQSSADADVASRMMIFTGHLQGNTAADRLLMTVMKQEQMDIANSINDELQRQRGQAPAPAPPPTHAAPPPYTPQPTYSPRPAPSSPPAAPAPMPASAPSQGSPGAPVNPMDGGAANGPETETEADREAEAEADLEALRAIIGSLRLPDAARARLEAHGSISALKAVSDEELLGIPGIGKVMLGRLRDALV